MRTSLTSFLDDFLSRGDDIAFAHKKGLRTRRWTYGQIAECAARFAAELEARKIVKGDRVLLWTRDSPEWVAAFFGCLLRGVIAVALDLQSEPGFVRRVQEQVEAKLALCDPVTSDTLKPLVPVIALDDLTSQIAHHSARPPAADVGLDDIVEIIFTSGTTAEPKGVCITHRNFLAILTPIEREMKRYKKLERLVHPIRFLNLVPLSHVFGQFMSVFISPLLGGTVFLQESLQPSQIIETVKRERLSVIVCVPRVLETLREKILNYGSCGKFDRIESTLKATARSSFMWRCWKFRRVHQMFGWKFWAFVSGGATLNPDTEEFWERLGFAVIQGYGMTETASLISLNHPFRKRRGSIGKVVAGHQVKLSPKDEILVRGDSVFPGYWKDRAFWSRSENGWFHTGDVGEIDAEGNIYFKGRQKDVIVTSAGMNIYPEDIELALNRQPEIKTNIVVGIDGAHGPEILAVLIPRDRKVDAQPAIERANQLLGAHQQVRRWAIWPEEDFPRTATQKIRKQALTEKMLASLHIGSNNSPHTTGRLVTLEEILSRLRGETVERLDPSAKLGPDLQLDSLARVELVSALEDSYHVEIDEAAFTETTTLSDVQTIISNGSDNEAPHYTYPRWQHGWIVQTLRTALLYLIVLPVTRIMTRAAIGGVDNLRSVEGPLVFICNHITLVDHALVLLALPGRFRRRLAIAMDAETLHKWLHPQETRLLTRLSYRFQYWLAIFCFNGFYLPQKSGFRRSFSIAGELVDNGYNLLIFPEGQRTKHGGLHPFLAGTGLLISKLEVQVLPLRIKGLWDQKKAKKYFATPGKLSVNIGEPVRYSPQKTASEIARDLEERVNKL